MDGSVHIRDSKHPTGPELHVTAPRLGGVRFRRSARSLSPGLRALPLGFLVWLKYPTSQV
ncbi:DUF397 domain-containing protein [Streptomyces sp. SAI-229]|uniref:DUF397 domain-containing protein n=1 Tax=Streptomyces sp. SAI-229 TaxID=3377731 RepID=UPI003C7B7F5A